MKKIFTHKFMQENCGCYDREQLMSCSFMTSEPVSLDSILNSEIPLKDKFWFVCRKLATKEQNQQIAIGVAEIVLHIYENKYPSDERPRKAIQAAKDYLAGKIDLDELRDIRVVAYAAAAYSYAAAAACSAAYFVDDDACILDDDAADYAASAAADDDISIETLLQFLKDFCTNPRA